MRAWESISDEVKGANCVRDALLKGLVPQTKDLFAWLIVELEYSFWQF